MKRISHNCTATLGQTAMHFAVRNSHLHMAVLLQQYGALVDVLDHNYHSPLGFCHEVFTEIKLVIIPNHPHATNNNNTLHMLLAEHPPSKRWCGEATRTTIWVWATSRDVRCRSSWNSFASNRQRCAQWPSVRFTRSSSTSTITCMRSDMETNSNWVNKPGFYFKYTICFIVLLGVVQASARRVLSCCHRRFN